MNRAQKKHGLLLFRTEVLLKRVMKMPYCAKGTALLVVFFMVKMALISACFI